MTKDEMMQEAGFNVDDPPEWPPLQSASLPVSRWYAFSCEGYAALSKLIDIAQRERDREAMTATRPDPDTEIARRFL